MLFSLLRLLFQKLIFSTLNFAQQSMFSFSFCNIQMIPTVDSCGTYTMNAPWLRHAIAACPEDDENQIDRRLTSRTDKPLAHAVYSRWFTILSLNIDDNVTCKQTRQRLLLPQKGLLNAVYLGEPLYLATPQQQASQTLSSTQTP